MPALRGHIAVKAGWTGNRGHQQVQGTVSIQIAHAKPREIAAG